MRICIIHGSPRKGNTYKATQIFKEELSKNGEVEFSEFFLPNDMPHFCFGCFTCFEKGEDKCPHTKFVSPIVNAIKEADGIVLTSPVYVLGETGAMKAFLDHCAYMFMPHRPMEEMFLKTSMIISTAAGSGTNYVIKSLSRNLSFWGVKRIYKIGLRLFAKNWDSMKPEKQQKLKKSIENSAEKFYNATVKRKELPSRIYTKFLFFIMKSMIKGYPDDNYDKIYWKQKGWI